MPILSSHLTRPALTACIWLSLVAPPAQAATLVYEKNCTKQQRSAVDDAFSAVLPIVKKGAVALGEMTPAATTPLYRTWFGVADDARLTTVKTTVDGLQQLLQGRVTFSVECLPVRCGAGTFALSTYQHDYMGFCAAFFAAPLRGENSQSGTVLHELTHVVADTDDHADGRDDSRRLATGDPNLAVTNADTFEYFLEDLTAK